MHFVWLFSEDCQNPMSLFHRIFCKFLLCIQFSKNPCPARTKPTPHFKIWNTNLNISGVVSQVSGKIMTS